MPDKKLTDNEIIKALECCADEMGCTKGCPCFNPKSKGSHCTVSKKLKLEKLTIDLINRLQAEVERLEKDSKRLKKVEMQLDDAMKMYDTIKAEAYKEFAERLKNEIIGDTAYGCDTNQHTGYYDYQIKIGDIPEYIDNLLKELVGDNQ